MTYHHKFYENILLTISLLRFYEHIHLSWKHAVHPALREKWYRKAQRILPLWHRQETHNGWHLWYSKFVNVREWVVWSWKWKDFNVKLDSLQAIWENIAQEFHHRFKKWRSDIFIDCLVLSSKEHHGISKGFITFDYTLIVVARTFD